MTGLWERTEPEEGLSELSRRTTGRQGHGATMLEAQKHTGCKERRRASIK